MPDFLTWLVPKTDNFPTVHRRARSWCRKNNPERLRCHRLWQRCCRRRQGRHCDWRQCRSFDDWQRIVGNRVRPRGLRQAQPTGAYTVTFRRDMRSGRRRVNKHSHSVLPVLVSALSAKKPGLMMESRSADTRTAEESQEIFTNSRVADLMSLRSSTIICATLSTHKPTITNQRPWQTKNENS